MRSPLTAVVYYLNAWNRLIVNTIGKAVFKDTS